MKRTSLNQGSLTNFLEKYKKVKTHKPTTLFDIPLSYEKLQEGRCPICGNKLTLLRSKPNYICKGKRHPDKKPFLIGESKLIQHLAKNRKV